MQREPWNCLPPELVNMIVNRVGPKDVEYTRYQFPERFVALEKMYQPWPEIPLSCPSERSLCDKDYGFCAFAVHESILNRGSPRSRFIWSPLRREFYLFHGPRRCNLPQCLWSDEDGEFRFRIPPEENERYLEESDDTVCLGPDDSVEKLYLPLLDVLLKRDTKRGGLPDMILPIGPTVD